MAGRGGTVIQFGKIIISSDSASLVDVKNTLAGILKEHGYPEGDSAHDIQHEKDFEAELAQKEKELAEDFKRLESGDRTVLDGFNEGMSSENAANLANDLEEVKKTTIRVVPPWERGRK